MTRNELTAYATAALRPHGLKPVYSPPEDGCDADLAIHTTDDADTAVSIQIGRGYYSTNRWAEDEGAMYHLYEGPHLTAAIDTAIADVLALRLIGQRSAA